MATTQTLGDALSVLRGSLATGSVQASLTLLDSGANPTVVVTAVKPGTAGSNLSISVASGSGFQIQVLDSTGKVLEQHASGGPYASTAVLYGNLLKSTALVTFAQATGSGATTNNPAALAATAMTPAVHQSGTAKNQALGLFDRFASELVAVTGTNLNTGTSVTVSGTAVGGALAAVRSQLSARTFRSTYEKSFAFGKLDQLSAELTALGLNFN